MRNEKKVNIEEWTSVLKSKKKWFDIDLKSIWDYKDLVFLLVRRDFVAYYKQTILGPLWFIIQPLFTTIVFTVIFGGIANIPTDGADKFKALFYMAGIVCWSYFAECLNKTANTFVSNSGVFGKVYFPRLIIPISVVITNLITFSIQFCLFLCFIIYFSFNGFEFHFTIQLLLLPLLLLQMALLGLGVGVIISSLTTKYRDLTFAVGFGVQLWMYGSSVVVPLSAVSSPKFKMIMMLNPMTSVIETFKHIFLGIGHFNFNLFLIGWGITLLLLTIGVILFNKVEQSFMDTV